MARTIGVQFSVGASVQRTVASAFGTVASRVKGLKGDLRDLEKQSKAATRLTAAMDKRSKIKAEYKANPTDELRAALTTANNAYGRAAVQARAYGVTVKNVSQAHSVLSSNIERTRGALARQQQLQVNQGRRNELQGQMMGTVASVMTVAAPITLAMGFEKSMANVRKVTKFDTAGLKAFSNELLNMSTRIPMAAEDLTQIAAAAGQAGIAQDELLQFTEDAAVMRTAFDMSADSAGAAMTGMRTNFKLTQNGVRLLGDAINSLSNSYDAKAAELVDYTSRVGGTAANFKMTGEQVAALGTVFRATKVSTEEASTATNSMFVRLGNATKLGKDAEKAFRSVGLSGKQMANLMQKDAQGALLLFLRQVKQSKNPLAVLSAVLGTDHSPKIVKLVNSLDMYEGALQHITDPAKYAGSQLEEFANVTDTATVRWQLATNAAVKTGIALGRAVLPALSSVLETVSPWIGALGDFAAKHETFTTVVFGTAAALVTLKVASLTGRYAATMLSDTWAVTKGVFDFCRSPIQRTNAALFRQRDAGNAAGSGMRRSAAAARQTTRATRQATKAMQAQNRTTTITARGLRGLGKAWMIATGPIGWVVAGLEILYNAFQPVRKVVDWIVSAVSSIPVIGPIIKTIANTLGFGGNIPDYETVVDEHETAGPAQEVKATTPKAVASYPAQVLPQPKALAAPEGGWSTDPNMQIYQMRTADQSAQTATAPASAKAWYDPTGWLGSDEPAPATAAHPMQTASGPAATAAVSQPKTVVQPMKTSPVQPEPQKAGTPVSRTSATPSERQHSSGRGTASGAAGGSSTVSLTQQITLNGITDADFARRVVDAVKARKGDFERLLSSIVDDQKRLAYGR